MQTLIIKFRLSPLITLDYKAMQKAQHFFKGCKEQIQQ